MSGKVGTVAVGAYADLIVVEKDPLKDLSALDEEGRYIPLVMKDGEFVKNRSERGFIGAHRTQEGDAASPRPRTLLSSFARRPPARRTQCPRRLIMGWRGRIFC